MKSIVTCLVGIAVLVATSTVAAQTPPKYEDQSLPLGMGFLILKNGHVVSGTMTSTDNGVTINRGNGVTVQFNYSEIDLQVNEFYEGYIILKGRLKHDDVDGHMNLASWCLRLGDVRSSKEQISYLEKLGVDPATTNRLRDRLDKKQQVAVVNSLPSVEPARSSDGPANDKTSPEPAQGDSMTASLPREILSQFNSEVQPRLINGCSTAGCHAGNQSSFQLFRAQGPSTIRSRTTQLNLEAVIQQLDQEYPDNSPLLEYMRQPHGSQKRATYLVDSRQYQHIRHWIYQLAKTNGRLATPQQEAQAPVPVPTETAPNIEEMPLPTIGPLTGETAEPSETAEPPIELAHEFVPRDEFDPEIFNRMRGKKKAIPAGNRKQ